MSRTDIPEDILVPGSLPTGVHSRFEQMLAARRDRCASADIELHHRSLVSTETVLRLRDATIDTVTGFVIARSGRLVDESSAFSYMTRHYGATEFRDTPNPASYVRFRLGSRRRGPEYSAGIWLGERMGNNYFHFVHDLLGKFRLLDELRLPDLPLLLNAAYAKQRYVKEFLELHPALNRRVVEVRDGLLGVRDLYVIRPSQDSVRNYQYARAAIGIGPPGDARLLLVRPAGPGGRGFVNADEVASVAATFGFEPYDPASDSIRDQALRFSSARYVVAAHGAGLVNLMFAQGLAGVLEIFTPNVIRDHYFLLCQQLGIPYRAMLATAAGKSAREQFREVSVDVEALYRELQLLIA